MSLKGAQDERFYVCLYLCELSRGLLYEDDRIVIEVVSNDEDSCDYAVAVIEKLRYHFAVSDTKLSRLEQL